MKKKIVISFFVGVFLLFISSIIMNHSFSTKYSELPQEDYLAIQEYSKFFEATEKKDVWKDFRLKDKTIYIVNKNILGYSYLINPKKEIKNPFVKKIELPSNMNLKVYRIPILNWHRFKILGNFSTINKTDVIYDMPVYSIKYDKEISFYRENTSKHFMPLLAHESFHYYMQNNWVGGGRFKVKLNNLELSLLSNSYLILTEIQKEMLKKQPDKNILLSLSKKYIDSMEERKKRTNLKSLKDELEEETIEGTAQYVSIKAAQIVGYDYGIMYFDNRKNVRFDEVVPSILKGEVEESILSTDIVYYSGALLCQVMDELEISGWQEKLNSQTRDHQLLLYDVFKEKIENFASK